MADKVRKVPCRMCPYRRDVPSGLWSEQEYEKLREYDGDIVAQVAHRAVRLFMCHQGDSCLCAGWAGHRGEPRDLLAIRVHASELDESVFTYECPVPLFGSGAEAADHGERDIECPSETAKDAIGKIVRVRAARGDPVSYG